MVINLDASLQIVKEDAAESMNSIDIKQDGS